MVKKGEECEQSKRQVRCLWRKYIFINNIGKIWELKGHKVTEI